MYRCTLASCFHCGGDVGKSSTEMREIDIVHRCDIIEKCSLQLKNRTVALECLRSDELEKLIWCIRFPEVISKSEVYFCLCNPMVLTCCKTIGEWCTSSLTSKDGGQSLSHTRACLATLFCDDVVLWPRPLLLTHELHSLPLSIPLSSPSAVHC